jgi:hypothetical protein
MMCLMSRPQHLIRENTIMVDRPAERSAPRTRKQKVEASIESLRRFYALGETLPPAREHGEEYGKGTIEAAAKKARTNTDKLRKARQLVDPGQGYTPAEMKTLYAWVRALQGDQEFDAPVFGRSHVVRLLTIPDKKVRATLAKKALKEAWSIRELEIAITSRYGRRRKGGRRPEVASDTEGFLVQVDSLCDRVARWKRAVDRRATETPPKCVWTGDADLLQNIERACASVARLRKVVESRLDDLRKQ